MRSQNSPRGLFSKSIQVPTSGKVYFNDYAGSTALLTANSTALLVAGGVRLSGQSNAMLTGNSTGVVINAQIRIANKKYVSANSTGFVFTTVAAKPATRSSAKWTFLTDSTGRNAILVNTTGTTWKFLNVTSAIPT